MVLTTITIQSQVVEVTPYRIRFLLQTIEVEEDIDTCIVIPNSDTLNTDGDLRYNTRAYLGYPLANLFRTEVTNQAEARALLLGQGLTSVASLETPRTHCKLMPRTTTAADTLWSVDANEGAAAGVVASTDFAVLIVCGPENTEDQEAYLDVYYEHSFDR